MKILWDGSTPWGAYLGGEYQMAGIKWIGSGPMNYKKGLPRASVTVILNDPDTKLPLAVSDGTKISVMRTGAAGGLAVRYLAGKKCKSHDNLRSRRAVQDTAGSIPD